MRAESCEGRAGVEVLMRPGQGLPRLSLRTLNDGRVVVLLPLASRLGWTSIAHGYLCCAVLHPVGSILVNRFEIGMGRILQLDARNLLYLMFEGPQFAKGLARVDVLRPLSSLLPLRRYEYLLLYPLIDCLFPRLTPPTMSFVVFLATQIFLVLSPFLNREHTSDTSLPFWLMPTVAILALFSGWAYWYGWWVLLPCIRGFVWKSKETVSSDGTRVVAWVRQSHDD